MRQFYNFCEPKDATVVWLFHGMCDTSLQIIFRSVIITKLPYASSGWWSFTNAIDR